ncbi:Ig-like domain-containing protein [Nocardioides sp. Bht2]|uniref:Ig-like domain-containing protein n=1 Tax=Nocardioides sp. Bht2 TaxID=3392297 RepID=UPI0039B4E9D5
MSINTTPRWSRWGAAFVMLLVPMVAVLAAAPSASADELDAITAVTITTQTDEVNRYERLAMEATWQVPDSAEPGDTFSLAIPPGTPGDLTIFAGTFDLLADDDSVVGTCVMSPKAITCTLSDYVATHDGVHGALSFWAQANQTTDADDFLFETGTGVEIQTPIPGGGVVPEGGTPAPTKPEKFGWTNAEGTVATFYVVVPGEDLDATRTEIVDTFDARMSLAGAVQVRQIAKSAWDPQNWASGHTPVPASQYTVTSDAASHTITVVFGQLPDRTENLYVISYRLNLPADAKSGDRFSNDVVGSTGWSAEETVTLYGGSGSGEGTRLRSLRLVKAIDGQTTATSFEFEVACLREGSPLAGFPKTVTVTEQEPSTTGGLPVGASCTLTETEDGGASEVRFTPGNVVEVTAQSPSTIEVTATNVFTTPTETPSETPSESPSVSESPSPSNSPSPSESPTTPASGVLGASTTSGSLPQTGAPTWLMGGALLGVLILCGGVALLAAGRGRRA